MLWIDPDYLPETSGVVDCSLLNAEGEADSLLLTDGTEVHSPPYMGGAPLEAVTPGSAVRVRGIRPRGVATIAVALVLAEGTPIVDDGSPENGEARKTARKQARATPIGMDAEGILKRVLHGPKGEVRGLLLEDGRAGFPPHAAALLTALLEPGSTVLLGGEGLSIAAVDDNFISWRFKPLDKAWPFVLITRPADRRLNSPPSQFLRAPFVARAVVGDVPIEAVEARANGSNWVPIALVRGETALWSLDQEARKKSFEKILRVCARDALGRIDEDLVVAADSIGRSPARAADGSDRHRIGPWLEKSILDTQLGPNCNGRGSGAKSPAGEGAVRQAVA